MSQPEEFDGGTAVRVAPPPPRGWHRPVSRLQLVLVAVTVLLLWLAMMTAAAWWFWSRGEARVVLRDQPLTLTLPEGLQAHATVSTPVRTHLRATPSVPVWLDQRVAVQFEDALSARVALRTVLPVSTTVRVDQEVTVSAPMRLAVPLRSWLPPLNLTVPVTLRVPVSFSVPVRAEVPLDLDVQVSGLWPDALSVPLQASWVLRPRIDAPIRTTLTRETAFTLLGPVSPMALRVPAMDLRMPVSRMALVPVPAAR